MKNLFACFAFTAVILTSSLVSAISEESLVAVMEAAKIETASDTTVMMKSARYKKIRGARVGNSQWNNEQWGSILEIENTYLYPVSGSINMKVLDGEGFVLDTYLLYAGKLAAGSTIKYQTSMFVKSEHLRQINSAILHLHFIRNR